VNQTQGNEKCNASTFFFFFLSGRLTGEYWDCRLRLDSKNTIVKVSTAGLDVP